MIVVNVYITITRVQMHFSAKNAENFGDRSEIFNFRDNDNPKENEICDYVPFIGKKKRELPYIKKCFFSPVG